MEIWEAAKEVAIEKVRRNKDRTSGGDSTVIDVGEVEKSFWLSRPDGWVVNRKMKKIILLEFKRTTDYSESYYRDIRRMVEQQHTPNGSEGATGRSRMGGRGCPTSLGTVVSQGKGVVGIFQSLWDRQGRWQEDYTKTWAHTA